MKLLSAMHDQHRNKNFIYDLRETTVESKMSKQQSSCKSRQFTFAKLGVG